MKAIEQFGPARDLTPAEWSGLESLEARTYMSAVTNKVKILDAAAAEGTAGAPGRINFTVKRIGDASGKAVVKYRTIALANPTAAVLGADLQAAFGKLVFKPGQKTQTIGVNLIGNSLAEDSKQFGVQLFKPKNTKLAKAVGVGTIANDDGTDPAITINDIAVLEGNTATKTIFFTVKLSKASASTVTVKYKSSAASATAPEDYVAVPLSTLTFNPGETTKTIAVQIVGDTKPAQKLFETFFMNLSAATNATIADAQGEATIEDND